MSTASSENAEFSNLRYREKVDGVCAIVARIRSMLHAISVMSDNDPLYSQKEISNLALHGEELCRGVLSDVKALTDPSAATSN